MVQEYISSRSPFPLVLHRLSVKSNRCTSLYLYVIVGRALGPPQGWLQRPRTKWLTDAVTTHEKVPYTPSIGPRSRYAPNLNLLSFPNCPHQACGRSKRTRDIDGLARAKGPEPAEPLDVPITPLCSLSERSLSLLRLPRFTAETAQKAPVSCDCAERICPLQSLFSHVVLEVINGRG